MSGMRIFALALEYLPVSFISSYLICCRKFLIGTSSMFDAAADGYIWSVNADGSIVTY